MKIIFESEEELNDFINHGCPSYTLGLNDHKHCEDGIQKLSKVSCKECWGQSGLEYEIKNETTIPKETVLNLNDTIRVKFTDYAKDIYYHQYDDLINQGAPMIRDYPKVDINGYTNIQVWVFMRIFGPHIKFGMRDQIIENNTIYIKEESIKMTDKAPKEFTYTDCVYELIKDECEGMDSIYEDYIVKLVGNCGLAALKRANLIESCGVLNCRQLYVLCERK